MRVRISNHDNGLDIEVEEHLGFYSPDVSAEILAHAFTVWGWAVEEHRQAAQVDE